MSLPKEKWEYIKRLPASTAKRIWPPNGKNETYVKNKHGPIGRYYVKV